MEKAGISESGWGIFLSIILFLFLFSAGSLSHAFDNKPDENPGTANSSGAAELLPDITANITGDKSGNRIYKIPKGALYSKKHVLVKFKEGVTASEKKNTHDKAGTSLIKSFGKIKIEKVETTAGNINQVINEYLKDDRVEYAEPDYIVQALATPNDPGFSQLWGLHNTGQSGGTSDADIDAPEAWDITTGGNIIVAVIDTGVNYNHEDLSANMWVNEGEIPGNGTDDDGNGYVDDYRGWDFVNNDNDPMDDDGHGSHCSGTIAGAGDNGTGVVGVNWTARIMPLKFLDSDGYGYSSDAAEAILYAKTMGARISSNSWGGGSYSQTLYDAIRSFGDSVGLFVAAAGNGGSDQIGDDNDITPYYPSGYDLSNIISVSATDRNDTLASFSNYGHNSVDLAAPGVTIYSTLISGYGLKSGTSMATPHVSGVAALLLSRNQNLTAMELKNLIMNNIDPVASLTGKTVSGGRLNARKAVEAISGPFDNDGDGYPSDTDCDDTDPLEHPDQTWYVDLDSDGYSDGGSIVQCLRPGGYYAPSELSQTSGDCDDNDPVEHPGQTWYVDADNDGYRGGITDTSSCARPAGFKAASELAGPGEDCDDNDPLVHSVIWYADNDGDGYGNPSQSLGQCFQPAGYVSNNTDCDDNDAAINPGVHETAYNGKDDDCNPVTSDHPWYDSTIAASSNGFTYTSIAVDSSGNAHISYFDSTSGDLKYATNVSGTWAVVTIDSAGISGENNSIAVDNNNKVHISYRFYGSGTGLKYATNASGAWTISTIYASEPVESTSLVIDSANKVHISFETPNSDALRYATNISGSWVISMIDYPVSSPSIYNSMAIDSNDKLHITYSSNGIRYATNQSESWVISTIPDPYSSNHDSSIAVDSNNKAHISYRDQSGSGYLKYATNSSGSWAISKIDTGSGIGCDTSIKADANNKIHISYYVCSTYYLDLKYATNESGKWAVSVLDSPGDVGDYSSMAMDSSDNIHISYIDRTNKSLKYIVKNLMDADNDADGFTENQGDCNDYDSFTNPDAEELCDGADNNCDSQIDEGLTANTFYWDEDGDGYGNPLNSIQACASPQWYTPVTDCNDTNPAINPGVSEIPANCIDDDCNPLTHDFETNAEWTIECLDSDGYVGTGTSIATDSDGKVHISYYGSLPSELKYITDTSGNWSAYVIDPAVSSGLSSIKIDSNDKAHIAYFGPDLRYATNESGIWVITAIDAASNVESASLALDSNNKAHISYYDITTENLRYAINSSGTWVISDIESTSYVGKYSSIAIDTNDKAHISYWDQNNRYLKYATNASGAWVSYTIDSSNDSGRYSSLAIDGNDRIHISYLTVINYNSYLKYSTNASGAWAGAIIDPAPYTGYDSIAVDSANKVHISYYGFTDKDLKYASNASGAWILYTLDSVGDQGQYSSIATGPDYSIYISYYDYTSQNLRYVTSNQNYSDNDGDGYSEDQGDCDDGDPLEHPDQTWYLDADGDGYSEGTVNTSSCTRPSGYRALSELTDVSGDCDDSNPALNPATLWYPDTDRDGYGNPAVSLQQCAQPEGYVLSGADCDDYDANIYPGGPAARVRGTTWSYYETLQEAYDASGNGDTIQGQDVIFAGDFNVDLNKTVTIDGGYDCGYSSVTGFTAINGKTTISNGSVLISNILIE